MIGRIIFTLTMLVTVGFIAPWIEQKTGYYECRKCHYRHLPTYRQISLAPHIGSKKFMKCPVFGKWSYQKKVLTKENERERWEYD